MTLWDSTIQMARQSVFQVLYQEFISMLQRADVILLSYLLLIYFGICGLNLNYKYFVLRRICQVILATILRRDLEIFAGMYAGIGDVPFYLAHCLIGLDLCCIMRRGRLLMIPSWSIY